MSPEESVFKVRAAATGCCEGVTLHPTSRPLVVITDVIPTGRSFLKALAISRGGVTITSKAQHLAGSQKPAVEEDFHIPPNITAENLEDYSLYEVLGLKNNTFAGLETIKKAYRKAVLLYHPDKQVVVTEDGHQDDQTIFLKIQHAFDTLSDESKRRAYDSQLDFDESIPSEREAKVAASEGIEAFCALYRPVFERNARFACSRPVPALGDADTDINKVQAFYSYWIKFDSWRDFSNVEMEHNPDQAGDRYEKRWMQKENAAAARKLKKKEMARVNSFVMTAYEHDPRIVADKEAQRKSKEDAKRKRQEEEERREAEKAAAAQASAEEAEKELERMHLAKQEKEKAKKIQSRIRGGFRKVLRKIAAESGCAGSSEYGEFDVSHVDTFCTKSDPKVLLSLTACLGGDVSDIELDGWEPEDGVDLAQGLQRARDEISATVRAEIEAAEKEEAMRQEQRRIQREKDAEQVKRKK